MRIGIQKKKPTKHVYGKNELNPQSFVYVIHSRFNGEDYCKVGYSLNPSKRVATLQTGSPELLTLAYCVNACRLVESKAHCLLSDVKSSGEWFKCSVSQAKDAISRARNSFKVSPPKKKRSAEEMKKKVESHNERLQKFKNSQDLR